MALPKSSTPERVNNDSFITEDQAVGLLEKEWKNLAFIALIGLLGIWFYTEYKETMSQRAGEASSKYSSAASELSLLIDESLKGVSSKEILEKEDRILNNLSSLAKSNDSSYSSFAAILKTAYLVFQGKELSLEESTNLDKKLTEYKNSKDSIILYEIVALLKCRMLFETGKMEQGIVETKLLLNESKIIFPEVASLLIIFSPPTAQEENKNFISEQLKSKPELEEQTKTALNDLGFSL